MQRKRNLPDWQGDDLFSGISGDPAEFILARLSGLSWPRQGRFPVNHPHSRPCPRCRRCRPGILLVVVAADDICPCQVGAVHGKPAEQRCVALDAIGYLHSCALLPAFPWRSIAAPHCQSLISASIRR